MAKTASINKFANSLTDYLIDAIADRHSNPRAVAYRYKNLKVYMDPQKIADPHFFVFIGISEACFTIEGCKRIEGALCREDAYITRWAGRPNIYKDLKQHWQELKTAISDTESDDKTKGEVKVLAPKKSGSNKNSGCSAKSSSNYGGGGAPAKK